MSDQHDPAEIEKERIAARREALLRRRGAQAASEQAQAAPQEPAPAQVVQFRKREEREGKPSALVCLADVQPQEVRWLWKPYIPIGKLTMIEGDPGVTKSWLTLALAATISRGGAFPGCERMEPANTLILTAEDGLGDTVRPRLDQMGADLLRVFSYSLSAGASDAKDLTERLWLDEKGIKQIRDMAGEIKPRLLVLDPVTAYIPPVIDTYRGNQARAILAPLVQIAEDFETALLMVRHLNKAPHLKALYRGAGSIDFTGVCRSVLSIAPNPESEDEDEAVIAHVKCNLTKRGQSVRYAITERGVEWRGMSDLTADDMHTPPWLLNITGTVRATNLLREQLSGGPKPAAEVKALATELDITADMLKEGRKRLGVVATGERDAKGQVKGWTWSLPT